MDERHAYCKGVSFANGNVYGDPSVREVCYDPSKVRGGSNPTSMTKPRPKPAPPAKKKKFVFTHNIAECHFDCDKDSDCERGLQCADQHKDELRAAGLDERHAYCKDVYFANGNVYGDPSVREVCYDPSKI